MVDTNTKLAMPEELIKARLQKISRPEVPVVSVEPAGGDGWTAEDMRSLLTHPRGGAFREGGPTFWPNDTFTHRRLREGSIKLVEKEKNGSGSDEENNGRPSRSTGKSSGNAA